MRTRILLLVAATLLAVPLFIWALSTMHGGPKTGLVTISEIEIVACSLGSVACGLWLMLLVDLLRWRHGLAEPLSCRLLGGTSLVFLAYTIAPDLLAAAFHGIQALAALIRLFVLAAFLTANLVASRIREEQTKQDRALLLCRAQLILAIMLARRRKLQRVSPPGS